MRSALWGRGTRRAIQSVSDWTASVYNAALATPAAVELDRIMRSTLEEGANAYGRAMDAEYLRTHMGGEWHRLFDGGHTVTGAWRAIRDALPDDSAGQEMLALLREYYRDLVTPRGMPLATLDKAWFDNAVAQIESNLGVSPEWVRDFLTFTSTEMAGGIAALGAMLLNLRSDDPDRYLRLCGSLGVSSVAAGNPILAAVMIAALMLAASRIPNSDSQVGLWGRQRARVYYVFSRLPIIAKSAALTLGFILLAGAVGGALGPAALGLVLVLGLAVALILRARRKARQRLAIECATALRVEYRRFLTALPAPSGAVS